MLELHCTVQFGTLFVDSPAIQTHQWTAGAPLSSQQSPTTGNSVPAVW